MAIKINTECIVCHQCLPECPNSAIYEPGIEWNMRDGTAIKGTYQLMNGTITDANALHYPIDNSYYYIVPDKCTECQGFHDEPQCAAVCPVDACVPDELYNETIDELMEKKSKMHD